MCTFRTSCCSARQSRAQVPLRRFLCPGQGGGGGGGGEGGGGSKGRPPALAGTREYEQSDRNR